MTGRTKIHLAFVLVFLIKIVACEYEKMKEYTVPNALNIYGLTRSPDYKKLALFTINKNSSIDNLTLNIYDIADNSFKSFTTPHTLKQSRYLLLWIEDDYGPLLIQIGTSHNNKRIISAWTKDFKLDQFYQLQPFQTIDSSYDISKSLIFANNTHLEEYSFKYGILTKTWELQIYTGDGLRSIQYSSKKSLICLNYFIKGGEKFDCLHIATAKKVYELEMKKLLSSNSPLLGWQDEQLIFLLTDKKPQKIIKLIVNQTNVKQVEIDVNEIQGLISHIRTCQQKQIFLFELYDYAQIYIAFQSGSSLKEQTTIELNEIKAISHICFDKYIIVRTREGTFGISIESSFHLQYLVISIIALWGLLLISLIALKKLYFLLKKSLICYFRSKKFLIILVIVLVSYGNFVFCVETSQNVYKKQQFIEGCYCQFFLITLAFSILQCSQEFQQQKAYLKLFQIRGMSIYYYLFSKLYYLLILLTLIGMILVSSQIALQSILPINGQLYEDFQDVLIILAGFIICSLSIILLYLLITIIFQDIWISNQIFFLNHLLSLVNVFFFMDSRYKFCPLDRCELLYYPLFYNGLTSYLFILLKKSSETAKQQKNVYKINQTGQLLLITVIQCIVFFIIICIIIFWRNRSHLQKNPKMVSSSIITESQINQQMHHHDRALVVDNLKKTINKDVIFQKVFFQVENGNIFALLGDSKSGKSTLIKAIIGLENTDNGSIIYGNQNIISCSLQELLYFEHLTFQEHLTFYLQMDKYEKTKIKEKIQQFVDAFYFENESKKKAKQLSGGSLKKLCLACALVRRDALIILDEPCLGVDVRFKKVFWEYLRSMKSMGSTIILATSDIQEIEAVADAVYSLNKKCMIAINSLRKDYIITAYLSPIKIESIRMGDDKLHRLGQGRTLQNDKKSCFYSSIQRCDIQQMRNCYTILKENACAFDFRLQNHLFSYDERAEQTQIEFQDLAKNSNCTILMRQFVGTFRQRLLIFKSNYLLNLITSLIILSICALLMSVVSNWEEETKRQFSIQQSVVFIRIVCFMYFQLFKVHLEAKNSKKLQNAETIGLHVGIYWLSSYLIDVAIIFSQLTIQFIFLYCLNPDYFYIRTLYLYLLWCFWYVVVYVAFAYVIINYVHQPTTFLFIFFYLNAFLFQKYLNRSASAIVQIFKYLYFPFTLEAVIVNLQSSFLLFLIIQSAFWLTFLAASQFFHLKLKLLRRKANANNFVCRQNRDVINQQYRIEERIKEKTPLVADYIFKRYQKNVFSLKNISIMVGQGEVYGLMGANGAGKSTLFDILTFRTKSQAGIIEYYGKSFKNFTFNDFLLIGYCPQFDYLQQNLTISQNINSIGRIKGMSLKEIGSFKTTFISYFQLQTMLNQKVKHISEGQRRKLCSILTFIGNPKILFFDQPSTGMDRPARLKLWKLIKKYAKEKKAAIILTTHNIRQAERYCDRVGLLQKGQLLAIGTPSEIIERISSKYRLILKYKKQEDVVIIKQLIEQKVSHFECRERPEVRKIVYDLPIARTNFQYVFETAWQQLQLRLKVIDYFEFYKHSLQEVVSQISTMPIENIEDLL